MARLTILQASQQGFGSTLTIHRHIKDGSLPVYEDGDTKLLEVNDLIAVFGEPKTSIIPDSEQPAATNGPADSREVARLRAELDQAQKRNMWLQADLAEAHREVKDKEAKFDKERERLLTVLEQAQALLLRAEGKIGPIKAAATPAGTETPSTDAAMPEDDEAGSAESVESAAKSAPAGAIGDIPAKPGSHDLTGIETIKGDDTAEADSAKVVNSKMTPEQEKLFAPFEDKPEADASADKTDAKAAQAVEDKTAKKENLNPMIPPLDDPNARSNGGGRALGAMTWLFLFVLAGGGFVFYEYRTKVLASVAKVLQAFS